MFEACKRCTGFDYPGNQRSIIGQAEMSPSMTTRDASTGLGVLDSVMQVASSTQLIEVSDRLTGVATEIIRVAFKLV
ncbi:MAG: hypothetical protein KatS3mg104_1558 [Phycisphaerae bacterium]|nr:MAG: hypothetical protein KatS3mg104_1558 [Phycisphaerae bacterium]